MALQKYFSQTLTGVGLKYTQDPKDFKSTQIFPICPVNLLSSTFPTYDKQYWMKNEAKVRTPGTESHGGVHGRGEDSYACRDIAYHEDVPVEYIENDPDPLNPERAATLRVSSKINLYNEVDFAARFMATGKWGTNEATPGTLWSAANSTPLKDIDGYKRTIQLATARRANKAVISRQVFDVLKRHPDVTEQVKYTSSRNVTEEMLAGILELDSIVVLDAVYDSAKFGATAAQGFVAGKHMLLLHTAKTPSLEDPSAGYVFSWNGYGQAGYGVERIPQPNAKAIRIEAHYYLDMKQMATDLGYFIKDPIA